MGGMIAQELALQSPQRVESLILACTTSSGLFGRWPHFTRAPRFPLRPTRSERERSLRSLLYAEATPFHRIEEDVAVRCQCAWTPKGFWGQFAGILMWSSHRRLRRLHVPTLVLHGEEDHLVPAENGKILAARIPGARFHLLPNAGHILTTDQPEVATQLLLKFLDEQTEAARRPIIE